MKLRLLLFIVSFGLFGALNAQVFWTEDFGTGCNQNNLANGTATANGSWTVTNTGPNHALANEFFISATEAGMGAGNCGDGCLGTGGNNRTLHIANVAGSPAGGLLCPAGDCGSAYDATTETSKRAESPVINCTGQTTITLSFDYMVMGEVGADECNVWYFDGATWSTIVTPIPQTQCCGGAACGLLVQGEWAPAPFSVALPASANNNPNVQIGFEWVNDNNNSGTDPSITIDNVTLSTPITGGPTASFSSTDSTLCVGDCIDFTDLSTGSPTGWTWYFPGSATATSGIQNPTNICYNTAGNYDVSLVADDGSNTDSLYMPGFITVNPPPTVSANAAPATSVCVGDMVTLTGGGAVNYTWTGGVVDGVPFAAAAGPTTYIVTGTDANGCTDTASITITGNNCSQPTASFTADSITICAGGDILFTDNSTGTGITAWNWTFNGGAPPNANTQGPHNVTFATPGVYNIVLQITDANGTDDTTIVVTVTNCNVVTAGITPSSTNICVGDSVVFTDASSGANAWTWNFDLTALGGATPPTANTQGPHTVFFNNAGAYTVQLIASDGTTSDTTTTINVSTCTVPTAGITMDDADGEICVNNCIDFTYDGGSGGTPTTIDWTFEGGTPSTYNSTDPNEVITVCWNDTTGNFNVDVTATNANGTSNASTAIVVHLAPIVNAGLDTTVIIGQDANLTANATDTAGNPVTGGTYTWTPITDLSCGVCQTTTVIEPLSTGVYTVTYTDQYGCVVTDDVIVNVDIALNIGVPSAFSPNGDGSNDILFVKGVHVIETMNFSIYNRYGQKVFETTDKTQGWDGTHNGTEVNPGVFVYYLTVTFIDGTSTETIKGNTTLVR